MSTSQRVTIIAEAGVNHNGSLELALQLIDVAAEAGVDAVKFQTFKPQNVISRRAPKAEYQMRTTNPDESQLDMARKLEIGHDGHRTIVAHCAKRGIRFLSTPFDLESLDFLVTGLKVDQLKIPSGEITNGPMLLNAARSRLPIILSTGMSTLGDVETALSLLAWGYLNPEGRPTAASCEDAFVSEEGQTVLKERVTLLHCTTEYPTPFEDVNLRAMQTMETAFGLKTGFSDHTPGVTASIAAVAAGASLIEKHFTLDKAMPGPDHKASLSPDELTLLVKSVREAEACMGNPRKRPAPSERHNRDIARKSLIAKTAIRAGEPFTEENLTVKRPGNGISPLLYWDYLGRPADRDYEDDELIGS